MTDTIPHDKPEQLAQIQAGLQAGEQIVAVYDGAGAGTGFAGVTNKRLILQDKSFAGKRMALTSIPYRQIRSVSVVSDQSMMGKFFSSSTIAVDAGGVTYEATFRGADKAKHVHDVILWAILQ